MNKTVQVNLGGQVFTMDDVAYEQLAKYLDRIAALYARSESKEEIIQDIEVRIAELLQERLAAKRSIVHQADIEYIISVMGRPEQFASEDPGVEDAQTDGARREERSHTRRLFRDTEQSIVGGVCSGIGYYFGVDPLWFRLAFAVGVLFFGSGIPLYIILWIVIPPARTSAERLSMKGEPVNIDSIGRAIEEEVRGFGDRVSEGKAFSRSSYRGINEGVEQFVAFVVSIARRLFKVVSGILGVLFMIIGAVALVGILAAVFGFANMIHFSHHSWSISMNLYEWGDIVFDAEGWFGSALAGAMMLIGIPFLALVYSGIIMINPGARLPYLGISLFTLWFIGLILCVFSGFSIARDFSKQETVVEQRSLPSTDTLFVDLGADPFNIPLDEANHASRDFMMKLENGNIVIGNVCFDIQPSLSETSRLEVAKSSLGASFASAKEKANAIAYVYEIDSNQIVLDAFFQFPEKELLRDQEVSVRLFLSPGTVVFLDHSTTRIIHDIDNVTHTYDPDMVNHYWQMREDGLHCLDCPTEATEATEAPQSTLRNHVEVNIDAISL